MTDLPIHRITPDAFMSLAEGSNDGDLVRLLVAAQHSKHALLMRQVVRAASAAGHEQAGQARRAYDELASIQEQDSGAVDAVLNHPPVASWARSTIRMLADAGTRRKAVPAQLASVAAAAAIRAGIRWSGEVPVCEGGVMLPSLGKVVPRAGRPATPRVVTHDGVAEVTGHGWNIPVNENQPGWLPLRSLSATSGNKDLRVVVEDLDPHRAPDLANAGARLSAAELSRWEQALHGAWDLLVRHHGRVAGEAAAVVRAFTPLTPPAHGQVSATSRQTFGSIALSAPPDARSLAVTIAHEIQHAKLSALLDVVPMTLPDDGVRYYAPWRDDPRPVSGLLQGAYAFLGVAAFWRKQRLVESGEKAALAHAEFARWRAAVDLVIRTLSASGRLTAQGQAFTAGMARALAVLAADPVPPQAEAAAVRAAQEHRALWDRHHGTLAAQAGVPA